MRHIDKQRPPDDIVKLNTTLLRTANHHYPYFASNDEIRVMLAGCEYSFRNACKADERDPVLLLHLNKRIRELGQFTHKPPLINTSEGQIQLYEMIQHCRECMQYLIAHFAVSHAWNMDPGCPWEDTVRKKGATYLETNDGSTDAGNAYYEFMSEHRIITAIQTKFTDVRDLAVDLLREMPPQWQSID